MPKITCVDYMIYAKWIIPVNPEHDILTNHCLIINQGKIHDLLSVKQAKDKYRSQNTKYLNEHVLLPGLINCHTHAAMTLFRGIADDIPLESWLKQHIWPLEHAFITPEFVRIGTNLAIAEMLLSGTTYFNDMYFFPDIVAQCVEDAGMRCNIGLIMLDFATAWANNSNEYLSKGLRLADEFKLSKYINTSFAPHAPYTVSDEPLKKIRIYADELDLTIHMHIQETRTELAQSIEQYGMRPLQRLDKLELISPRMMAVHMTHLTKKEIALLSQTGANVVHCPRSNLKLASGISPINDCLKQQVNIALGTDSAASNNDLNMLGEMRYAALLAKGQSLDAQAVNAWQALEMATINGAKALNVDDRCGSLTIGKNADMIAIDLSAPHCQPVYHPVAQVVYTAARSQVSHSWVDGQMLVENHQLSQFDLNQTLAEANAMAKKVFNFKHQKLI